MKTPPRILGVLCGATLGLFSSTGVYAQTVTVDVNDPHQTIQGFGGMHHPAWQGGPLTEAQMALAFGNGPGQIGLTILRIPVLENSGSWGDLVDNALDAQTRGALVFASPWNPPGGDDWREQRGTYFDSYQNAEMPKMYLQPAHYADYAAHLNAFYDYMTNQGVDLYAVSVQNEPDYGHGWTWWEPEDILKFMKENAGSLNFRVMAPESFQYRKELSDPILNDPEALANLDILGTHFYGTQTSQMPYPNFEEKGAGIELWMTEVYTDSSPENSSTTPSDFANEWPRALRVARNVHDALVEGQMQAYVWWYIERSYSFILENTEEVSKRGWCIAHYSKFVRRGWRRVEATKRPLAGEDVWASAFTGDGDVAVVLVNETNAPKDVTVAIADIDTTEFQQYTTSATKSLADDGSVAASAGSMSVTLDPESVTTLFGDGEAPVDPDPTDPDPTDPDPTDPDPTDPDPIPTCAAEATSSFTGTPVSLPGTVEAEDFDVTGYSDDSPGNEGGEYRTDVDVDIKALGDGYAVGWMTAGEWLQYTVDVQTAGQYEVTLLAAAVEAGRTLELSVCGTAAATLDVPVVADWGETLAVSATVQLGSGLSVIRVSVGGEDYIDLDSIHFELIQATEPDPTSGTGGASGDPPAPSGGTGGAAGDPAQPGSTSSGGSFSGGSPGGPEGEGGSSDAVDAESGCGCRTAGGQPRGAGWLGFVPLLLALGAAGRRRRAQVGR